MIDHAYWIVQTKYAGRDSEIAPTNNLFCRRELRFPTITYTHKLSLDCPLRLLWKMIAVNRYPNSKETPACRDIENLA